MKWSFWIELYIRTHCVARGLRPLTLAAYEDALKQFREWVRMTLADRAPDQVTARDVLATCSICAKCAATATRP